MHSKTYVSRFVKMTYNLERREYFKRLLNKASELVLFLRSQHDEHFKLKKKHDEHFADQKLVPMNTATEIQRTL